MPRRALTTLAILPAALLLSAGVTRAEPVRLPDLVKRIQPAVVTVITYGLDRNVQGIGSGFFVSDTGEIITTSVDEKNQTPESIPLIKTYPNPFNPSTTIEFTLPESGFASVTIYSMAGQKIRELTADYLPAGTHTLTWDGKDTRGNAVSSGIYITHLEAGKHTATGRMVLVR